MHVTITKAAPFLDTQHSHKSSLNSTKRHLSPKRKHAAPFKVPRRMKKSSQHHSTETIEMIVEGEDSKQGSRLMVDKDDENKHDSALEFGSRLPGADSTTALLKISDGEASREAQML